ncbi:hypothetical protein Rifp1Sym_cu00080 [endosymbiont of Riftia pachyptila (vent Ph05)]|uniref:Uncharacterized protein n=1 Tax=endosymbiont of Riftia pachyptila (vent Ph05) TaxID=1048808 RepID=G2DFM2_9GAMM|nr:hypothetical protein Rifp1Sym_cu00080 [endosymbiont of Riftia pachyptila (vent Ph05)]
MIGLLLDSFDDVVDQALAMHHLQAFVIAAHAACLAAGENNGCDGVSVTHFF